MIFQKLNSTQTLQDLGPGNLQILLLAMIPMAHYSPAPLASTFFLKYSEHFHLQAYAQTSPLPRMLCAGQILALRTSAQCDSIRKSCLITSKVDHPKYFLAHHSLVASQP